MSDVGAIRALSVFSHQGGALAQEDFALGRRERGLFAVADGFGGPGPGAEAAKTACEAVLGFLEKEAGDSEATLPFVLRSYLSLAGNVLFNALVHANRRVMKQNGKRSLHERGGASVLCGYVDGDTLALANVGGCSAWVFRGGRGHELVLPRTYARLMNPFHPDPESAWAVPLMAVGVSEDLEPEMVEFRVLPGDWVLLQTDGVREINRNLIADSQRLAIAQRLEPEAIGEKLLSALRGQTFPENASLALVMF